MIEIYNNKELYTYIVAYSSFLYHLSMQRLENPEMSIVYGGAPTCNTLPLDNSKTYSHPALPYITWGLIQDSKIRKEESLELKFSTRQVSGLLKLRQEGEIPIENFCKLLVSQLFKYKQQKKVFEAENSASRKRSPLHKKGTRLSLAFKNHQIQASGMS